MNNRRSHILLCLIALLLTACEKEPVNSDQGISAALSWADPADAGREIKSAHIWIYRADGDLLFQEQYDTKQAVAGDIHAVESGDYRVVTAINFHEPFSLAKAEMFDSLIMKLGKSSASLEHTHYSVATVLAEKGKNIRAQLPLRRVLAELTIEVVGAPQGTTLEATVLNVADGIVPSQKENDLTWGKATDHKQLASLQPAISENGVINTETIRLMPTIGNASHTYLHLTFRLTDGTLKECLCEAPPMKSAGKYSLKLKYSELRPLLHIDPIRVNDWEEGWIVSGEILNPNIQYAL